MSPDRLADKQLLLPSIALLIAGLCFRLGAVPFHFYAPDVFQGVTTSSAAMLSIVPKIVGVVALVRLLPLAGAFAQVEPGVDETPARLLLGGLAVVTMFLGNLLALRQQNLLRLVAYSSIAHAGYMLVGLATGVEGTPVSGVGALVFYLAAYGITTLALFCLLIGACSPEPPRAISDIAGLSRVHPAAALLAAVCLFSLTGLPPTAGFMGKLNLFMASWSEGSPLGRVLACSLALNAAISAWYYLRLIGVMYLDEPSGGLNRRPAALAPMIAGGALAAATIILFLEPQPLWDAAVRCIP